MTEPTETPIITAMNSPADLRREYVEKEDESYLQVLFLVIGLIDIRLSLYFCCIAVSIGVAYYAYLDSLYIIDEVMEAPKMRILSMNEKFTIRVNGGNCGSVAVKEFIGRYSVCESVAVIQLRCQESTPVSDLEKLSKDYRTSVIANVENKHYDIFLANAATVPTSAVMFLELDQRVTCSDLAFTHTTWRSSQHSLVGYFPRLLTGTASSNSANKLEYSVSGPLWVWWYRAYSLMLSPGVMLHKDFLWKDQQRPGDKRERAFRDYVGKHEKCIALSLYLHASIFNYNSSTLRSPSSGSSADDSELTLVTMTPPIWVDVSVSRPSVSQTFITVSDELSECVNGIQTVLAQAEANVASNEKRSHIPIGYSRHKSYRASQRLFW